MILATTKRNGDWSASPSPRFCSIILFVYSVGLRPCLSLTKVIAHDNLCDWLKCHCHYTILIPADFLHAGTGPWISHCLAPVTSHGAMATHMRSHSSYSSLNSEFVVLSLVVSSQPCNFTMTHPIFL